MNNFLTISGFLDDIPRSENSHYNGWARVLAAVAREVWDFEVDLLTSERGNKVPFKSAKKGPVLFHHGLYYYGEDYSLNLFGGMNESNEKKLCERIEAFLEVEDFLSLEYPWPKDLFLSVLNRANSVRLPELCLAAQIKVDTSLTYGHSAADPMIGASNSPKITRLVIGDSHAGASWLPGSMVFRNDRETLHGALKRGLKNKIQARYPGVFYPGREVKVNKIAVHYGNIDVRHHLCRLSGGFNMKTIELIKVMCAELVRQLEEMEFEEVELVGPYPIENESRAISKSVWFEGKPFWGSWAERTAASQEFNLRLAESCARRPGWKSVHWGHLRNSSGELDFDFMEKPKSIHISPRYYRGAQYLFPPTEDVSSFFS